MSTEDINEQGPDENGTYPQLKTEEPELTTFAEPDPVVDDEDVEYALRVVNSQENWTILDDPELDISWQAENETQTEMMAVFNTKQDMERAREALSASSEPYPLYPD